MCVPGALGGQKRLLNLLKLELQTVVDTMTMWVLGIELDSLEEQPVLLTAKPSLSPLETTFTE